VLDRPQPGQHRRNLHRNAVDKDLAPWSTFEANQTGWDHLVDTPICPIAAGGPGDALGKLSLRNGQACFFFSHGCTIHCDKCDGKTARFGVCVAVWCCVSGFLGGV